MLCQQWDGERCHECADGCSGVEYGCGEGTVTLGKILGCHLHGSREIARLAYGKHAARRKKEVHAYGCYRHHRVARGGYELRSVLKTCAQFGSDAAQCVQTRSGRPYSDGPEEARLGAEPVNRASGKQHTYGIDNGERGCDISVMNLVPVEFRFYEFIPRE